MNQDAVNHIANISTAVGAIGVLVAILTFFLLCFVATAIFRFPYGKYVEKLKQHFKKEAQNLWPSYMHTANYKQTEYEVKYSPCISINNESESNIRQSFSSRKNA